MSLSSTLDAEGKRYALIVGVKTYRAGQPLPPLAYTENDADDLATVLKTGGYDVTLMTQTQGRKEGKELFLPIADYIRDQLTAILENPFLKSEDIVIVALAGHGVQYEGVDEEGKKTPRYYFCPMDANIDGVKAASDVADRNRLIDLGELYSALNQCKAGGKLLLVDACRNDPSKPGLARSAESATLPSIPPPPGGTAAFFSCSAHQRAIEDKDLQHGVFFHHVIQALSGQADTSTATRPADRKITLSELSEHVSLSTYDFVRKKYQGAKQAPELKGQFRLTIPLIELKDIVIPKPPELLAFPFSSQAASDRQKDWSEYLKEPVSFSNSIGMKFTLIPPGWFLMGSTQNELSDAYRFDLSLRQHYANSKDSNREHPQHRVRLTQPFYVGTYEVTKEQFAAFVEAQNFRTEVERTGEGGWGWNQAKRDLDGRQRQFTWNFTGFPYEDNHPVVNVSWDDASAFCDWLSRKEGKTYRLLTEAEWEYVCRAGTDTQYSFGNSPDSLIQYANIADASAKTRFPRWVTVKGNDGAIYLAPVGSYRPNPFGLYDMHGNAWEWCADWYDSEYYSRSPEVNPPGPSEGMNLNLLDPKGSTSKPADRAHVFRGGSWFNTQGESRSAIRYRSAPRMRVNCTIGFRVAMIPGDQFKSGSDINFNLLNPVPSLPGD